LPYLNYKKLSYIIAITIHCETNDMLKVRRNRVASHNPKGTVNTCVVNCYKWQVVYGTHVLFLYVSHRCSISLQVLVSTRCI